MEKSKRKKVEEIQEGIQVDKERDRQKEKSEDKKRRSEERNRRQQESK